MLNAPNNAVDAIVNLLPCVKSPSITPLLEEGWSAIHSVVSENEFWEVVDKLQELGAEGILVLPIEMILKHLLFSSPGSIRLSFPINK